MFRTVKKLPAILLSLLGLALVPLACSADDEYQNHHPKPPGTGGFDPGDGGLSASGSGTGSGASSPGTGSGSGTGGQDPGPPECDNELKRCNHEFTYADMGETS